MTTPDFAALRDACEEAEQIAARSDPTFVPKILVGTRDFRTLLDAAEREQARTPEGPERCTACWHTPLPCIGGHAGRSIAPPAPAASEGARGALELLGCGVCGAATVTVRPRYPGGAKREVCPTCLADRLASIHDLSAPNYGQASQEAPK
jgi:hypothetical protein